MGGSAEELCQRPDVRKELQRATGGKNQQKIKAGSKDKFWFVLLLLILVGCVAAYFFVTSKLIPLPQASIGIAERILRGTALIVIVLAVARATNVYGLAHIEDASTHFTLRRVVNLIAGLAIAVIVVSMVFVNWYAAIAALGVGSIIVGLAVQAPMKSFIAWIYILVPSAIPGGRS